MFRVLVFYIKICFLRSTERGYLTYEGIYSQMLGAFPYCEESGVICKQCQTFLIKIPSNIIDTNEKEYRAQNWNSWDFWSEKGWYWLIKLFMFNSGDICFPFLYRSISIEVPLHLYSMLQLFQSDLLYQHSQKLLISQQNSLPLLLSFS